MKWALTHHREPEFGSVDLFRHQMDGFFDDFFALKPSTLFESSWVPSVDVSENDTSIHVKADMPGMSEKDISVTVEKGMLTISGEKKEEQKEEKDSDHFIISERSFGSFSRSIALPESIKAGEIKADFKNGVLNIMIPKEEKAQPERIEIKVN